MAGHEVIETLGMDSRDTENWRQVINGDRPVRWSDFVGSVQGATYLSDSGRDLLPAMVTGFESWFGDEWLRRALDLENPRRISSLARFSPTMTVVGATHGMAGAFVELVRWWAAIETQLHKPGIDQVQRDQRQDATLPRLLHTLTQLRLGAIATQADLMVAYEPLPGDLLITDRDDPDRCVTVEVFAMTSPRDLDVKTRQSDEMFALLNELGRQHGVQFRGDLPALDDDTADWERRVREAAAQAGRLNISLSIRWSDQELFVEPGDSAQGAALNGPPIEVDAGSRLRRRVSIKARQVADAPAGWLWLENHGAIDLLVPVNQMRLFEQLVAYRDLLHGALDEVPAVKGVSFSGSAQRQWPPRIPARATDGQCEAFRHPLTLDRVRTTFHLANVDGPPSQLMRQVVEHEPYWLDSALSRLGVTHSALELIRPDIRSP